MPKGNSTAPSPQETPSSSSMFLYHSQMCVCSCSYEKVFWNSFGIPGRISWIVRLSALNIRQCLLVFWTDMDSAPQMEILDSTSLYRTEVHGAFPLDAQIYRVVFRPSSRQGFKNISVRSSKLFCLLKTLIFLYSSGPLMLQVSAHKAMDNYQGLSQIPPCRHALRESPSILVNPPTAAFTLSSG
jgi:hypothetical protein